MGGGWWGGGRNDPSSKDNFVLPFIQKYEMFASYVFQYRDHYIHIVLFHCTCTLRLIAIYMLYIH